MARHLSRSLCPLILGLASLLNSCSAPSGIKIDPNVCQQTFEFGNSGCADIQGNVLNSRDEGLSGIVVTSHFLPGSDAFNGAPSTTDGAGRFTLRITRFIGAVPSSGPDTVSVFIVAADPRSAGVRIPATVRDSVLTRVTIAPVGTVPVPAVISMRLGAS